MTQAPPAAPSSMPPAKQGNGLAVAGMVLGIIALGLFCFWFVSIPCAIVGLILSLLGNKKAKETGAGAGMAKAGMILGIIAIALAVLIVIAAAVGIHMFGPKIQEELQKKAREATQQATQPTAMLWLQSLLV